MLQHARSNALLTCSSKSAVVARVALRPVCFYHHSSSSKAATAATPPPSRYCVSASRSLQWLVPGPASAGLRLRGSVTPAAQAGGIGGSGGSSSGTGGAGGGGGSSGGGAGGDAAGDSSPHPLRVWTWAYAAFLAAGGVFAYVKAGSRKSLTSALGAALILALSGRKMLLTSARGSIAVCLAISVFLSVIMAGRYSRSRKVMPAGMTAAVSMGMSAAYIFSLVA